ncbi:LysR substrate-binding domain-containing protein [Marinobacter sp. BSs20148]|jgi:DNA-binding transcriptional LysR family regulator|uniref:LysR substrate-binding domain-containing protein n=1 Tax=Marinobacter sp. BSs20148 TaxID=490759 RepID=UPI000277692E|nr:LysR substrate-binding domain-containing protein [Marinobacter sp. BSs20148]AFP30276.1 HTH-type transcriptional regulator CysL [Marinobacter sp. BSs20148]
MNLHLLRTFASVAEYRSFSRAGEAIHISQPAVSRAVRELEEQLEISLLERRGGQVNLTQAGAELYEHARSIFALEKSAMADLRGRQGLARGSLTVGASRTIGTYFLPPVIAEFLRRYPAIDVRIISENTELIQRRLLAYELDVAFIEGSLDDHRVEQTFWHEDELVILAHAHHSLLRVNALKPSDMDSERWVVREEGSGTRTVTLALLKKAGVNVGRMIEVGGNGALVQSVAAGLGLAMVSSAAAREHLSVGKVNVLEFPVCFKRPMHRVRLRNKPASPAAQALMDVADDVAKTFLSS